MRPITLLRGAIILALLSCSCQPGSPGPGTPGATLSASPSAAAVAPTPTAARRGVVVVALDGGRADWIRTYTSNGTMANLAALADRGVKAAYMETVDPALPLTSYLALSSGLFPSRSGWVSDRYHLPEQRLHEYTEPWQQLGGLPEPVWRTAMRNGLRTAVLFWPAAPPDVPQLAADYMAWAVDGGIPSALHVISLQDAGGWHGAPSSFSPPKEAVLRVASEAGGTAALLNVLALDSVNDETETYDLLFLDVDKDLSNGCVEAPLGAWAAVAISPRLHSGAYFCFTASDGVTATVYQSRASYNRARPAEVLQSVNTDLGFPPPQADAAALQAGWLSPELYYEMAERYAKWMTDVVLYVYQAYQPDLLLTAQAIIAQCAQGFLLVDERQMGYSLETAELYPSYLRRAHAAADENLGRLLSAVNLADSLVFVLSPQGLMPVHTTIRVNTILTDAKLLQWRKVGEQYKVDESKSQAFALASGGSAHVYVNLEGREWPGLVPQDEYAEVQDKIVQALVESQDEDGQALFARVHKREELSALYLDSPNAGDVFVQARPGYVLSDKVGFREVLAEGACCAAVGYAATSEEMHGFWIGAGDGLPSGQVIQPVSVLDLAPTIAKALNFEPPQGLNGQPISGLWP